MKKVSLDFLETVLINLCYDYNDSEFNVQEALVFLLKMGFLNEDRIEEVEANEVV